MTEPEKQKLDKMEDSVEKITVIINGLKLDMLEIKYALLGNNISGDTGFKGRLYDIDVRQKSIEIEMKDLRDERVRNSVYIKIITWLLAVIGVGIVGLIFIYFK